MDFDAGDLVKELEEEIKKQEKRISGLQSTMWHVVGINGYCHFVLFASIAEDAAGNDWNCKAWPFYLRCILGVSAAFILLVSLILVDYLGLCKEQDEYIEKLDEALNRAHPGSVHIHAKEGAGASLFCAVLLMLSVLFNIVVYCGANALCAAASGRP